MFPAAYFLYLVLYRNLLPESPRWLYFTHPVRDTTLMADIIDELRPDLYDLDAEIDNIIVDEQYPASTAYDNSNSALISEFKQLFIAYKHNFFLAGSLMFFLVR
jgi:hypothetical protein